MEFSWDLGPAGSHGASSVPAGLVIDGRYAVIDLLGQGGMGAVYRVHDQRTGRQVALKQLLRSGGTRDERFAREGALTASLQHPAILRVHDGGWTERGPYLVYELVEGAQTLEGALAGSPVRRRVELLLEAARGLGHAHEHGVVHRDVKPTNILVDREGRVRVADFGLATAVDLDRLTRTGALVGTPRYMSPEQISGRTPDPTMDVWALGVMLFEALCEESPFEFSSLAELTSHLANLRAAPSPRRLNRATPPALDAICRAALAPEPGQRYPHAGAFADDLQAWLDGEPISASSVSGLAAVAAAASRNRWLAVPAAALAILGITALLTLGGEPAAPSDEPPPSSTAAVASPQPAAEPASDVPKTLPPPPDGLRFVRGFGGQPDHLSACFLGADRIAVAAVRRADDKGGGDHGVYLLDVSEPRRPLPEQFLPAPPLVTSLTPWRDGFLAVGAEPGARDLLRYVGGPTELSRHPQPLLGWPLAVSPDGSTAAAASFISQSQPEGIRVLPLDGGAARTLNSKERNLAPIWDVAFLPDGRVLSAGWGSQLLLWDREPPGEPLLLTSVSKARSLELRGNELWVGTDLGDLVVLSAKDPQQVLRRLTSEAEVDDPLDVDKGKVSVAHKGTIHAIRFDASRGRAYSLSSNRSDSQFREHSEVRAWEIESGRCLGGLRWTREFQSLDLSPDGSWFVIASGPVRRIEGWGTAALEQGLRDAAKVRRAAHTTILEDGEVPLVVGEGRFLADDRLLTVHQRQRNDPPGSRVALWSLADPAEPKREKTWIVPGRVTGLLPRDEGWVAVTSRWKAEKHDLVLVNQLEDDALDLRRAAGGFRLARNERWLTSFDPAAQRLRLWRWPSLEAAEGLSLQVTKRQEAMAFLSDGRLALQDRAQQRGVVIVDPATRQVETLIPPTARPTALAGDPRGHLWVGTQNGELARYDGKQWAWLARTKAQPKPRPHAGAVRCLTLSPDGRRLYSVSHTASGIEPTSGAVGQVRAWDTRRLRQVGALLEAPARLTDVRVSPDGRWLLLGARGRARLELWDTNVLERGELTWAQAGGQAKTKRRKAKR